MFILSREGKHSALLNRKTKTIVIKNKQDLFDYDTCINKTSVTRECLIFLKHMLGPFGESVLKIKWGIVKSA